MHLGTTWVSGAGTWKWRPSAASQAALPEDICVSWHPEKDTDCMINVDVGLLESSVLKILLNARDAMPDCVSIDIRISRQRGQAEVRPQRLNTSARATSLC